MVQMFLSWTEVPLVPGVRLLSLSLSLGFCMILLRSNKSKTMVLYPNSFLPKQIRLRFWHHSDSPRMIAINFHRHLFTIEDHRNTWRYMETHTVETHTYIWKHMKTPWNPSTTRWGFLWFTKQSRRSKQLPCWGPSSLNSFVAVFCKHMSFLPGEQEDH